jgi:hypothetical protein
MRKVGASSRSMYSKTLKSDDCMALNVIKYCELRPVTGKGILRRLSVSNFKIIK